MDGKFYVCLRFDDLALFAMGWLDADEVQQESEVLLKDHLGDKVTSKPFNECCCCNSVKEQNNRVIIA